MLPFEEVYQFALQRFPNEKALEEVLPIPRSSEELESLPDAYYLSEMTRRVFRAGFRFSVVDGKWPAFEKAFFQFNLLRVAMMSDEELEAQLQNKEIIRYWRRIKATRENATFLLEIAEKHGSVGKWLASWPAEDIVSLWQLLKKQATFMGGISGPAFLRMVGKDTPILSPEVVTFFVSHRIIDNKPTSKGALATVQKTFNQWAEESGRPLCQISKMVSYIVD